MCRDEIDLPSIGQRKTALFVEMPDTDRLMDILANMFFTQAHTIADDCDTLI